jgi:hypothetical protein
MGQHEAHIGEKRNAHRLSVTKSEVKRSLGKPRRRRVDNIKLVLRGMELSGMDWIGLAQDRDQWECLVNTVMSLRAS